MKNIDEAHNRQMTEAYGIVSAGDDRARAGIAAAICFRRKDRELEFLLVRTKGGDKWTFPKGHVEPGERQWESAAREAREEAGASGTVEEVPLTDYAYPGLSADGKSSVARAVRAYLLEVTSVLEPAEPLRTPRWCSTREARELLAEGGREPRYVAEHHRVIDLAVSALVTTSPVSPAGR